MYEMRDEREPLRPWWLSLWLAVVVIVAVTSALLYVAIFLARGIGADTS